MSLLNPYSYIAGAVVLASVGGTIFYQNERIHHFHKLYDSANVTIVQRDKTITDMTIAQKNQIDKSDQLVIKVVQGPKEVQSIIKEVQSAPAKGPCTMPNYSKEVMNAF
jgi:hypothetical protein